MLLHLFHELVETLGRVISKHLAELLHEAVEVGLLAGQFVLDHLVKGPHHFAGGGHVLFRHTLDLVHHLLAHVLGHLALQRVQQVLELLLGLRVYKVIFQQLLYLTGRAFRKGVQLFPVVLRTFLQQV